jgi:hypothetical protein
MLDKSGIDDVPCRDSCVDAADENRIAAETEVVAIINVRVIGLRGSFIMAPPK